MKKILPISLVAIVGILAWVYFNNSDSGNELSFEDGSKTNTASTANDSNKDLSSGGATGTTSELQTDEAKENEEEEYDDRPAAQVYSSAEEALEAVKKAALDYDDIILEQFVRPGEDCTWCEKFYSQITDLMVSEGISEDERAYYSEILAISGKLENIKALVESIKGATNEEISDILSESLELTLGDDSIVKYLAELVETSEDTLQEASIAAITNQGSNLAAKTLYEHAVKNNDPTGGYDLGIGLAEMIPDEESLPQLQEIAQKRDPYSHLAVKSMLNAGHSGVALVFDLLTNSTSPDFDQQMLKDALDHVVYEEETERLARQIAEKFPDTVQGKFAKDIIAQFSEEEGEDYEEATQQ